MNLRQIVETLHLEGDLEESEIPRSALPPAWYIRILSGLGAWLATLFLSFFWAILAHSEHGLGVFLGGMQCFLACLLARQVRLEFFNQFALSLWLTGSSLLIYSSLAALSAQSEINACLFLLALAAVYPENLGRFLTALAAGALAVASIGDMPMDLLVAPLAILAGAHYVRQRNWWCGGWGRHSDSFAGASVVTVLMALCASFWHWCRMPAGMGSTLLLTLGVLWLTTRVVARLQVPMQQGLWALVGVLALGGLTLTTPGIMAGVGVLLLACEARSRWLLLLGWLYLLIFTSAFYYNLDLLLRTKSLILVAMGALLLGLRREVLKP